MKNSIGYKIANDFVYTNKNVLEICSSIPEPHPHLLQVILKIIKAVRSEEGIKKVFSEAESFIFKDDEDIALYVIFLNIFSMLCYRCDKEAQNKVLLRQSQQLLNSKLPALLKWHIQAGIASNYYYQCEYEKSKRKFEEVLFEIPNLGSLFCKSIGSYLSCLDFANDYKQLDKFLNRLESIPNKDDFVKAICSYFQFNGDVLHGGLQNPEKSIQDVLGQIGILEENGVPEIQDYVCYHLQYLDIFNSRDPSYLMNKFELPVKKLPDNLRVLQSLLNYDPQSALSFATSYWDERNSDERNFNMDIFYVLTRAQLANRNLRTARDLIERRQEKCGSSYVDDFFLSKIALIEGNREEAHQRFSKSVEYAKKYGCLSRIKLELRLSCELRPDEAVELVFPLESSRLVENQPSKVKVIQSEIDPEVKESAYRPNTDLDVEFPYLVGSGKWYEELTHKIKVFASADSPVLIIGETGTGKELVARALHDHSSRRDQSYLSINCGALSSSLLQSELFGHVKGAFTGAERRHKGVFEEVGEGTLFLDEMGDAPHEIQTALLRVLESGEYKPIGSSVLKKTNCCLVFATNVDLKQAVTEGRFRKDLYYRLNQLLLTIPPLRERRGDIMLLSKHFLSLGHPQSDKVILTDELSELLNQYEWPGNIRELRNEVEYMKLMNRDKVIYGVKDLRPDFLQLVLSQGAQTPQPLPKQQLKSNEAQNGSENSSENNHSLSSLKPVPISSKNSKERRYDQLKELFEDYHKLSRANVCELLGVSPTTATTYLRRLCDENYIEKVTPTPSPRTHYFVSVMT